MARLPLPSLPMPRIPIPKVISAALVDPMPAAHQPMPIRDRTPDPGLFGPDSMTWRVMREPLLLLGGGRALLVQVAHPLVAQGAIEHSNYAEDPYGRLLRTIEWVTVVAFGTTAEAERACAQVTAMHRRVRGRLPSDGATAAHPRGRAYSGLSPALLRWVHASFVDTMLRSHDAFIGGLRDADRDVFVREWNQVATLMKVPPRLHFDSDAQLRAYIAEEVASGRAVAGPGSKVVARTVLRPPVPTPLLRPAMDTLAFASVGLLPAPLRGSYGILWTPAHTAAHAALCRWLRTGRRLLPSRLRRSPVFELASARSRGEWIEDAA